MFPVKVMTIGGMIALSKPKPTCMTMMRMNEVSLVTSSTIPITDNETTGTDQTDDERTPTIRSSGTQLRRAAGSQSFDTFRRVMVGYSAVDIDKMIHDGGGKSPLHMAAWKGCLDNLRYLIETIGCNVDIISTGEFNYGKTALFYALTQSREAVVDYLLERGACVKIVNNKGQSPLSIASSHLSEMGIGNIRRCELEQQHVQWINYRTTHSDGLEYGDLDPRFLEREICESDIVTAFAINPTSKESRKGNFRRKNPHIARENNTTKEPRARKTKSIELFRKLSSQHEEQLEKAWERLEQTLISHDEQPSMVDLTEIIKLNIERRHSWIPETASRLKALPRSSVFLISVLKYPALDDPIAALIQRILAHMSDEYQESRSLRIKPIAPSPLRIDLLSDERWLHACLCVEKLSMRQLETYQPILSLPQSPVFVNSVHQLSDMEHTLLLESVIAMDAEWHNNNSVATFQVAVREKSWVIDLLHTNIEYQAKCRHFICTLFGRENVTLLGFSASNDISRLDEYVGKSLRCLPHMVGATLLDEQELLFRNPAQMPGLAACVAEYSSVPLCKQQQCSDWSQRPLSPEQLEYAGLDAAILSFLLAEKYRQVRNEHEQQHQ